MSGHRGTFAIGVAAILAALVGCAGGAASQSREVGSDAEVTASIRGFRDGLEVHWWLVRSDPGPALEGLGAASTLDEETARRWAAHGLRVLAADAEQLTELSARLGVVGGQSGQGQWLGQAPLWTPVIEGPARGPIGVSMESGPLALPAGRLRLLGRAWSEPAAGARDGVEVCESRLRVELVPQHVEAGGVDSVDAALGLVPKARDPLEQGLVLRRLAATVRLAGGEALVIVPERPDVEWGGTGKTAGAEADEADEADEAANEPTPIGQVIRPDAAAVVVEPAEEAGGQVGPSGPRGPRLPTLGEAMLMSRGEGGARVMVVLVARLPEQFRLLPD